MEMEMEKSRVLIVGGTGYIGKRIVKASLAEGHPTYVLRRAEIGLDIDKLQALLEFKRQGARLIEASFSDHASLVEAVKQVDVVICTMSGVHFRSHNLLMQLKLVRAIQEAGNIKRFLPSEFGLDPAQMENALEPGRVTFDEKMIVRKAIEEAQIPYTYVSANCFAGYFVGNLSQMETLLPPKHHVRIYGDGNVKAVFMDEDDVAKYTIKSIDDPRALNKTLYLRPPENILSQRELVEKWEKLVGKTLDKTSISKEDFMAQISGGDFVMQVGMGHFYHIFYEGFTTNFEIGENGEEASKLYPDVEYTRIHDYLKRYIISICSNTDFSFVKLEYEIIMERFLPSEFGLDPAQMENALEPGRVTFDEKMIVRRAIEEAQIPYTYVSANCFAGYFVGNLSQMETLLPPKHHVRIYGDGNVKAVFMDEDDVAKYTIKSIDDPRALNKTLYLRPPENILSQRELVEKWEKLVGKTLDKTSISKEDFLAQISGGDFVMQVGMGHFYHIFYEGFTTNFEIGENGEEASKLYPEVEYTRIHDYLKRYM